MDTSKRKPIRTDLEDGNRCTSRWGGYIGAIFNPGTVADTMPVRKTALK